MPQAITNWDSSSLFGAPMGIMPMNDLPKLDTSGLSDLSNLPSFTAGPGGAGNWWDGFLGSTAANGVKTQGWGGTALGVAQGLGSAFLGMKQYGLAKDQLAQGKEQFAKNYAAQQKTTNAAFEDRQRARVAANPGAYQSVGDYMKQNGI